MQKFTGLDLTGKKQKNENDHGKRNLHQQTPADD